MSKGKSITLRIDEEWYRDLSALAGTFGVSPDEVARQSLVLLKNAQGALPLGEVARVAVVGPNADDPEVLLGSADMMPRNLKRRVEALFPVPDPALALEVKRIFDVHFADTVKGRWLCPDGTYLRARPGGETEPLSSQDWLIVNRGVWHGRT